MAVSFHDFSELILRRRLVLPPWLPVPVRPKAGSAFEPEFVAGLYALTRQCEAHPDMHRVQGLVSSARPLAGLPQYVAEHTAVSGDAILAGGVLARVQDFTRELYGYTPWMRLLIVGGGYLLLWSHTKTLILPLKAALMNFLPTLASFGLLTLVFQEGWLRAGLHTPFNGGVSNTVPFACCWCPAS